MSSYIVEFEGHDGNAVVPFRYAQQTFAAGPADPEPNVVYEGRVLDAGQIQRTVFGGIGRTGAADVSYGFIELNNGDQELSQLKTYAFDGRPIRIWRAVPGQSLVGRKVLFRGVLKGIRSSNAWESLELLIKDRQAELGEPLLRATYAGTTVSADKTVEGNADLKGQIKPCAWGAPSQVPLVLVNAHDGIWQACANAVRSIRLFDGGVPLVHAGDHPTISAMMAAPLDAGAYRTCLALGLVRPGRQPALTFTADIVEGVERSAARVVERMLRHFGLVDADIDRATFDALHAARPEEVESYVSGDTTALAAVQAVLDSVQATIIVTLDGRFRLVLLEEPDASKAVRTFTLRDMAADGSNVQLNVNDTADGDPIPTWQMTVEYGRLYRPTRKSELAGSLQANAEKVAYFESEVRREIAERPAVKARHLLSKPTTVRTQLVRQADAKAQAEIRVDLQSRQRDRPSLALFGPQTEGVDIGDTVILRAPVLDWQAGKAFRVLGVGDDFDEQTRTLDLWG